MPSLTLTRSPIAKGITKPGVLIEVGFISNYAERTKLLNEVYQEELASVITTGVIKYLQQS